MRRLHRYTKSSPCAFAHPRESYADLVDLWILRILVRLGGYRKISANLMSSCDEALARFGVSMSSRDEEDKKKSFAIIKRAYAKVEAKARKSMQWDGPLVRNIQWLGQTISLQESDIAILTFMVLLHNDSDLAEAADELGQLSQSRAIHALAVILDLPSKMVEQALRWDSVLPSAGLIKFDNDANYTLKSKLELRKGFPDALFQEHASPAAMLARFFDLAPAPKMQPEDFRYAQEDYQFLRAYLVNASRERVAGVNILIHGRPGTGKTQLVRTLCHDLGSSLYEVAISCPNGEPLDGSGRFAAYRLGQRLFAGRQNVALLFDEIEDVFPRSDSLIGNAAGSEKHKAWINRTLEENPVPAFWLSNSINQIDEAYLRRFDYIMELRAPTAPVRQKILRDYLGPLNVRAEWVEGIAENRFLVPAHIERAAKVARLAAGDNSLTVERTFERVIGNVLVAMGHPGIQLTNSNRPLCYDPGLINADCDLDRLVQGIRQQRQGRVCLYGAPGTGKTAFGKHLAEQIERPLVLARASDILSKYVGEAEKNLAQLFRQAKSDGAVLMLDEADSFLQDRVGALKTWEITQVNELLVQMENFGGVFVASTNLMNIFDGAALRRFDFKIRFDYLKLDQRYRMFCKVLHEAGLKDETSLEPWRDALQRLDTLTPGDFAVAVRQLRVLDWQPEPKRLFDVLEQECRAKRCGGSMRPIGFCAPPRP